MNNCIITGRLTADAELKMSGEKSFTAFTIANNTGFGDKKKTNFIRCVSFGKQAEVIAKHFEKGSPILVSGEWTVNSFTGRDGVKREQAELIVREFDFIGEKKSSEYVAPEMPVDRAPAQSEFTAGLENIEFPF